MKRTAALGFIFVTVLLDVIGLGIIIPVLPDLIEELIKGDVSEASRYAGWLMFSFAFMQFIFAPILGGLSDKYGRRPVLLLALFGLGINYMVHVFAPTIGWLFISRLFAGIFGASFTTANAYIADISPPEKRSQNFGIIGAAFGLGFIIGPVMGGIFSQWGIRLPFLIAAILSFINLLYGFFILPESLDVKSRRPFSWARANPLGALIHLKKYPVIIGLIITIFLSRIAGDAIQSTWTFYTKLKFDWSIELIGYSLGLAGLLVVLFQGGLIRVILPLIGHKRTIQYGLVLWGFGLLLFGIADQDWMLFAFMLPYTLGGLAGPAIQGIISNQVPINEQGELQGAITSVISITSIIGPPLMTGLFAHFTAESTNIYFPGVPFILGAFLIFICLFFTSYTFKRFKEIR